MALNTDFPFFPHGGIFNWWDRQTGAIHQAPSCRDCHDGHRLVAAEVQWTWPHGGVEPLCQRHLDDRLDYADEGVISEPTRVQWLNGTRTLVNA